MKRRRVLAERHSERGPWRRTRNSPVSVGQVMTGSDGPMVVVSAEIVEHGSPDYMLRCQEYELVPATARSEAAE